MAKATTSGESDFTRVDWYESTLIHIEPSSTNKLILLNNNKKIRILFFAALHERAGTRNVSIDAVEGMTVDDVVHAACKATPSDPKPGRNVMLALNGEYVQGDHLVNAGDEIALIPPVSGGSGDINTATDWIFISPDELDPAPLTEFVTTEVDGAVVTFLGVTRDQNEGRTVAYLEYEAYQPMAENKIAEIVDEMRTKWELGKIAIAHRTGKVDIGETSMVVAVGSVHRRPAFESALYFVDRLKEIVPIWKKELFEGGEVWIGETPGSGNPSELSG
ncbi:MAG: molybdopterin converting factor subunit 1 [Chloroflexi bacterium]|nr:molybdopterin converting factor subunit 1 [Chloroflexota bacterium]